MIEKSDFNDGDILAKTTQLPCKGGHKFKYVYDDGHEITSECITQDKKREALHLWVDVVKNTAVARAEDERAELRARARRQKADAEAASEKAAAEAMGIIGSSRDPSIIVPTGTRSAPSSDVPEAPARIQSSATAGAAADSPQAGVRNDPISMAKSELVNAMMEVQELQPRLAAAQQRAKQWQAVLSALSAVELPKESTVIDASTQLRDLLEK